MRDTASKLVGSCEPCGTQKKAPVFKISDVVVCPSGNVFSIGMIFKMHGELRYSSAPYAWDAQLGHRDSFSGHSLHLYKGKK